MPPGALMEVIHSYLHKPPADKYASVNTLRFDNERLERWFHKNGLDFCDSRVPRWEFIAHRIKISSVWFQSTIMSEEARRTIPPIPFGREWTSLAGRQGTYALPTGCVVNAKGKKVHGELARLKCLLALGEGTKIDVEEVYCALTWEDAEILWGYWMSVEEGMRPVAEDWAKLMDIREKRVEEGKDRARQSVTEVDGE